MKTLLNFLLKYHVFFLFLLLELISLTFIVRYNNFHRVNFLNSSNAFSGVVFEKSQDFIGYFSLRRINDGLAEENARLKNELQLLSLADSADTTVRTINEELIRSYSAKVINNSVNKQYNYITLNKGIKDGIMPDMGVINSEGIVGVVINVSEHYSTALSVLNGRWSINAKLDSSSYFGPLRWEGSNPYLAVLEEIPYHVEVKVGERVVTSGYSAIFPEGILIGKVIHVEHDSSATFQKISVQLSTDFKKLLYVEIIENITKQERQELENINRDE